MSHFAYYNDNDPFVCRWLENLIVAGHIANGDVDCRPIEKVQPSDLEGYTQCHFFAGIGGWSYALRLAGWKDEWPIILPKGKPIPYVVPGLAAKPAPSGSPVPTTGNFTWRDDFDGPSLNPAWIFARVPREQWADLRAKPGALTIHPRAG